jgi:tRNA(fMet)-specific endonuclease VapC
MAAITAAELLVGVELAHGSRRDVREAFVADLLATVPVEEYDLEVARAHARLLAHVRRTGKPRGAHDLIIAATAAASGRTVVTSDAAGFDQLPDVAVLDPSSP